MEVIKIKAGLEAGVVDADVISAWADTLSCPQCCQVRGLMQKSLNRRYGDGIQMRNKERWEVNPGNET